MAHYHDGSDREEVVPGAPEGSKDDYNEYIESMVEFLKAKRDDLIRKGYEPTIDRVIEELEKTKYDAE